MSSQWQFNFSWTALIVQQRHQPSWGSLATKCRSKNESLAPSTHLGTQKGNYFQWPRKEHDKWNAQIPMAIRLQESDMVIWGCVHSHEIPKKTRPSLLSQACQAKLGMAKRVREGSITLDVYDAQSLEVVRQIGTGLFMNRIDHLIYNYYVRKPLLDDVVIDFDDEPGTVSTARDSDQTNSLDCFTRAMVNVCGCEIPRNVLQADTTVVSCGLANFEQSS